MYIRFISGKDGAEKLANTHGIFTQAKLMLDQDDVYDYHADMIQELFDWFNDNLPVPPFDSGNWSSNAVSWFKSEATLHIQRVYELKHILDEYEISTIILKMDDIGNRIYEDDYQVVGQSNRF